MSKTFKKVMTLSLDQGLNGLTTRAVLAQGFELANPTA